MPERHLLERHKFITDDNQQFPWQLLNRIQNVVCAPYVFNRIVRLMCKKPNARIYGYSGCCATIPPTAPATGQDHLPEVAVALFKS